jgi:hypothetical protein
MLFSSGGSLGTLIVTELAAEVPGYRVLAAEAAALPALLPQPAMEPAITAASKKAAARNRRFFHAGVLLPEILFFIFSPPCTLICTRFLRQPVRLPETGNSLKNKKAVKHETGKSFIIYCLIIVTFFVLCQCFLAVF